MVVTKEMYLLTSAVTVLIASAVAPRRGLVWRLMLTVAVTALVWLVFVQGLNMSLAERKDRYEHLMRAIRAADLDAWRDNFMRDLRSFISQPSAQRAKKVELVEPE